MPQHLVKRAEQLPNLPADLALTVDVESTSFDDDTPAFRWANGHLICGCGFGTADEQWYIPLRHHSGDAKENFPFEQGVAFLRDLLGNGRPTGGHNYKFDLHFLENDDIKPCGSMWDTMVLGRLVDNNRWGKTPYSADALARDYLGMRKDVRASAYLSSIKSEDYGRIPASIMGPYCCQDVEMEAKLLKRLMSKLRPESKSVWSIEKRLLPVLQRSERRGIPVNIRLMKEASVKLIKEILDLEEKIAEVIGYNINPSSNLELTTYLCGELGIEPKVRSKETGRPKWDAAALKSLNRPECEMIVRYNHLHHIYSTYCEGWLKRIGDDGRLHTNFFSSGTRTGRLSSRDPNLQNVPNEAEAFVELDDPDRCIVMWDYSQIEYRIFGHYTQDPKILGAYQENARADFHQLLANMLGVPRQFAKQLNFSFLYGMGRQTLLQNIAAILSLKGNEDMYEKMRMLSAGSGKDIADRAKQLDGSEQRDAANSIYEHYHSMFPSIRQFQQRVKRALEARGWIRNLRGRVYYLDRPHKGVNYLVQGSSADIFKERMVAVMEELDFDQQFLTNVHDSVLYSVPVAAAKEFYHACTAKLEEVEGLRVPLLVDGRCARRSWHQVRRIGDRDFYEVLKESEEVGEREWGVYEEGFEHTKGRITGIGIK